MPRINENTNVGLTNKIIEVLEQSENGSMWISNLFEELVRTYPELTRTQMHGCLGKLVGQGRVYHLTRGAYAHPEKYSGVK